MSNCLLTKQGPLSTRRGGHGGRSKSLLAALLLAFALRLFFSVKFPHVAGDSILYENFALNLVHHRVYSHHFAPNGASPAPTLIRVPGYPFFLAAVFLLAGDQNEKAVRVAQSLIDTLTCLLVGLVVFELIPGALEERRRRALWGVWLAALCPFIGNYAATILAEVPTTFLLTAALLMCVRALNTSAEGVPAEAGTTADRSSRRWFYCGLLTGLAVLFRPESGLWILAPVIVLRWRRARLGGQGDAANRIGPRPPRQAGRPQGPPRRGVALLFLGLILPLLPWTARNLITLKTFQPLAPMNAEDPGEFIPRGYPQWCRTWLWRYSEIDRFWWTVPGAALSMDALPPRAFDTADERRRVAELFTQYNATLQMDARLDSHFAALARERMRRHPFCLAFTIPALRSVTLWLAPRVEVLPLEGRLDGWPLGAAWENDPRDFLISLLLFLVNLGYLLLALVGAWKLRHLSEPLLLLLALLLLRTVFLAYFTFPEPRYVLEAYPAVLTLGAWAMKSSEAD